MRIEHRVSAHAPLDDALSTRLPRRHIKSRRHPAKLSPHTRSTATRRSAPPQARSHQEAAHSPALRCPPCPTLPRYEMPRPCKGAMSTKGKAPMKSEYNFRFIESANKCSWCVMCLIPCLTLPLPASHPASHPGAYPASHPGQSEYSV